MRAIFADELIAKVKSFAIRNGMSVGPIGRSDRSVLVPMWRDSDALSIQWIMLERDQPVDCIIREGILPTNEEWHQCRVRTPLTCGRSVFAFFRDFRKDTWEQFRLSRPFWTQQSIVSHVDSVIFAVEREFNVIRAWVGEGHHGDESVRKDGLR